LGPAGGRGGVVTTAGDVDEGRLDSQIAQGRDGGVWPSGRDRAPAQTVEPFGQRSGKRIVPRHDQNAGLN